MRVALAGFGFMGRTHAACLLRNPSIQVAAIVEREASAFRERLGGAAGNFETGAAALDALKSVPVFESLEECLDRVPIEAVDICLPTLHHVEATRLCLERGKHVLVEKPFVLSVESGRSLIDLARSRRVVLMVAQVVRFMPAYEYLRRHFEERTFGPLNWISLTRRTGVPAWGHWTDTGAARKASGGALFDLMIHDIDFLQWVLGEPESMVSESLKGTVSDHDYIHARWDYSSGIRAFVEGGFLQPSSAPFEARFAAQFHAAYVEWSSRTPGSVRVSSGMDVHEEAIATDPDGFQREIDYFAECVQAGRWPERCSPESSLRSIELAMRHAPQSSRGDHCHA